MQGLLAWAPKSQTLGWLQYVDKSSHSRVQIKPSHPPVIQYYLHELIILKQQYTILDCAWISNIICWFTNFLCSIKFACTNNYMFNCPAIKSWSNILCKTPWLNIASLMVMYSGSLCISFIFVWEGGDPLLPGSWSSVVCSGGGRGNIRGLQQCRRWQICYSDTVIPLTHHL